MENSEESRVTLEVSKDNRVTLVEMLGHATAGIGLNLIYGFWATYMLVFYTDVFGITAAAASIIMVISRIWDGINDPMMGAIADRTRTRWGRYRFLHHLYANCRVDCDDFKLFITWVRCENEGHLCGSYVYFDEHGIHQL